MHFPGCYSSSYIDDFFRRHSITSNPELKPAVISVMKASFLLFANNRPHLSCFNILVLFPLSDAIQILAGANGIW